MKKQYLMIILVFAISGLTSCMKKQVNSSSSNEDTTNVTNNNGSSGSSSGPSGSSGSSGSSGDCYGAGTGAGAFEYFTLPNIVVHGAGANIVQWSSATDPRLQTPGDQDIFDSDTRFNIRVLAMPSPGQGIDTYGFSCDMVAMPYTKLQVKVGVKKAGAATYSSTYVFDDIPVDGCSDKRSFYIPNTAGDNVIEIMNIKWDYTCNALTAQGFPDQPQCPWDYVFRPDCVEVVLQLATDSTRDIP